jgi:hypothetical protein
MRGSFIVLCPSHPHTLTPTPGASAIQDDSEGAYGKAIGLSSRSMRRRTDHGPATHQNLYRSTVTGGTTIR